MTSVDLITTFTTSPFFRAISSALLRVIELLKSHRMSDLVAAVERAKEHDVDDPAAIELLLVQRSTEITAPLAVEALPPGAQIDAPQARLDSYIVAELKEVA